MKIKFKSIVAVAVVTIFSAQAAYALSLKLRKEQKKAQEKIEKSVANINKSCGCAPKLDINWESFETTDDMRISWNMVDHVSGGMGRVCKEFKKEVCAGIKTVKIGKTPKDGMTLKEGTLDIGISAGNHSFGDQAIQKLIENNL